MLPPQVSAIILVILLCERTSSTSDQSNHQNLYQFGYTVRDESTRDFKTHQEVHDGKQVRGMYSLGEPNGDVRVVTYTADGTNGFRATVKVHPFGSPGIPTLFSDTEKTTTDQQPGHYTKQATNQEKKNTFQINTTLSPIRLTNSIIVYNLNTSEPEGNLKEAKLKEIKKEKSEHHDIKKSGQDDHLYDVQNTNEQVMIIDNDYLPQRENIEGDHEQELSLFRQSILSHSQEVPLQEPQIIPVQIQDDPSSDAELLGSETNIEMSTFYPLVNEDIIDENIDIQDSTEKGNDAYLTSENNNVQDSSNISQIEILDQDLHKGVIKLEDSGKESTNQHGMDLVEPFLLNQGTAANKENILNSMKPDDNTNRTNFMDLEMNTKIEKLSAFTKPVLETTFNKNDTFETTDIKIQNLHSMKKERNPAKIRPDGNIQQNNIENIKQDLLIDESNENKEIETPEVLKNNKLPIMLTALLIPTSSVLKLSCSPNMLEKEGVTTTPALPSKPPIQFHQTDQTTFQSGQNPIKSIFTTGSPVYPFQLVHFSPVWNHQLNSEDNKHFSAQHSIPTFSARPSGTFVDGLRTTMPQQITYSYPVLHDALTTFKPEGFSSSGTDSATHPTHRLSPIGQYSHHFLPPPWAPHPFRSTHTSHHRQMPIFVLPMSHNSNFAPTFNPKLQDNFNQ